MFRSLQNQGRRAIVQYHHSLQNSIGGVESLQGGTVRVILCVDFSFEYYFWYWGAVAALQSTRGGFGVLRWWDGQRFCFVQLARRLCYDSSWIN
jgi:hypothetical protein